MTDTATLVWFKRDLRVADHAPLAAAQGGGPCAALYLFEPAWLESPECGAAHVAFAIACLAELRASLARLGLPLLVRVGAMPDVLDEIRRDFPFTRLLCHEETGPAWSWQRDKTVAAWCRARGVEMREFAQTGVVRGLKERRGWAARWAARMNAPQAVIDGGLAGAPGLREGALPTLASLGMAPNDRTLPPAGERAARETLESFLATRAHGYRRNLSSPLTAESGCSRLSAHLAFGAISMRQVHQATEARIAGTDDPSLRYALRGFAGRLRWHCHFVQKLEDEPGIEFRNFARHCDGLREHAFDRGRFEAWRAGLTGYPMVDACMRQLRATGWINFRMRAMLVSFAAYHLWLHWRAPGLFLARQFLDFEPGIHWSQMQMQSGTTGINTLRIYSPTKQAKDQDPEGAYVRRWVPELARVPLARLAQPWTMDGAEQSDAACVIGRDYPAPIVDERAALAHAKDRVYALRKTPEARAEADAIQRRHGSRRSGLPRSGTRRTGAGHGTRAARADDSARGD